MFDFIRNLFKKRQEPVYEPEIFSVPQTGVILRDISDTDAIMGIKPRLSGAPLLESGNWAPYLPTNEAQSIRFTFDTLSCTTFSVLNSIEMLFMRCLEKGLFSPDQIMWLKDTGYFDENGRINFSDRFTAITSGTTRQGNTHFAVFNACRNIGLIPERDLPFGGRSWEEYHNTSLVTQAMRDKAKRFLQIVEIVYEWVFLARSSDFTEAMEDTCRQALLQAPLAIAVKYPATHAVTMYAIQKNHSMILDQYDPYTYEYNHRHPIHYAYRAGLIVKKSTADNAYPEYVFTRTLKYGSKGDDVIALQKVLFVEGFIDEKYITGNFYSLTQGAVSQWQAKHGLIGDGIVGAKSRAILNDLCLKKK